MPIKINGATSGSTTITAPATGGDESIELSTALAAKMPIAGGTFTSGVTVESSVTSKREDGGVGLQALQYSDTSGSNVQLHRYRGSVASPSAVQASDIVSRIISYGWSGTQIESCAEIRVTIDGTPGANDMPGRIDFLTAADGTDTLAQRMRIGNDGTITFANVYAKTVGATNRDLFIDSTGVIGYVSSVRDSKTDITEQADVSWLTDLTPVTFRYRAKDADGDYTDEPDGPVQYGLIAEDVHVVNPDLCFYDDTDTGPELRGVSYSKLITPLLALVQQQQKQIDALTARLDAAGI
jgi:Chaperone of endosialidase